MYTPVFLALVTGYFLGSLPFGYLVARGKGVNIFEVGSKSPGATNVRRTLGSAAGNLVFLLDALKGAAATAWPTLLFLGGAVTSNELLIGEPDRQQYVAVAGLIGALVGHSFSCFTRFRGGKGVATAAGGLIVIIPQALLVALLVWILTFFSSRYVSLASIFAALALPISVFWLDGRSVIFGVTIAIAAFVIVRHRANIQRLFAGTESKVSQNTPVPKP
ncbi:MAG: hypothetical protein RIQ93_2201 [Verrucomicrobiota bacterium]|jgi:glycerol-3-phosphate acyltransferase PlsY